MTEATVHPDLAALVHRVCDVLGDTADNLRDLLADAAAMAPELVTDLFRLFLAELARLTPEAAP